MENNNEVDKFKINLIDINSVTSFFGNPKKAWQELLQSINNIQRNFKKSQIDPKELKLVLIEDDKVKNNIPDVQTIKSLIDMIDRYIKEYKMPGSIFLFLEFKRHAAIYLFSIGSQDKAIDLLKEILTVTNETNSKTKGNEDINIICIRDCVKLNLASINFWLEKFDESRAYLEDVILEYESRSEELYHIKMVNFISVAFTYLAWIFTKNGELEDAEKAFLHSLRVIKTVKKHSKESLKDDNFINTKTRKIFIYDQLINFYTYTEQIEHCQQPLHEILKLMDKKTFTYDIDISPVNHVYYYLTACLYCLSVGNTIDLSKTIQYLLNILIIIFRNSEHFESIPQRFYEVIFQFIEIYNINDGVYFHKKPEGDEDAEILDVIFC
jgi:tetratricopeptide (TPR) repeat protein